MMKIVVVVVLYDDGNWVKARLMIVQRGGVVVIERRLCRFVQNAKHITKPRLY